jgi:hypothetical protein
MHILFIASLGWICGKTQFWEIKEGKCRAMQLERYIKKLSRKGKDKLAAQLPLLCLFKTIALRIFKNSL